MCYKFYPYHSQNDLKRLHKGRGSIGFKKEVQVNLRQRATVSSGSRLTAGHLGVRLGEDSGITLP